MIRLSRPKRCCALLGCGDVTMPICPAEIEQDMPDDGDGELR